VAAFVLAEKSGATPVSGDVASPWNNKDSARFPGHGYRNISLTANKTKHKARVHYLGRNKFSIGLDKHAPVTVEATLEAEQLACVIDGHIHRSRAVLDDHTVFTFADNGHFDFVFDLPAYLAETGEAAGSGAVKAPMTGTIKEVLVKEGDVVVKDQPVLVMVAMKMEVCFCWCCSCCCCP
jgi:3-methylcrotonyl-CoA carboxylase alpha subunit